MPPVCQHTHRHGIQIVKSSKTKLQIVPQIRKYLRLSSDKFSTIQKMKQIMYVVAEHRIYNNTKITQRAIKYQRVKKILKNIIFFIPLHLEHNFVQGLTCDNNVV